MRVALVNNGTAEPQKILDLLKNDSVDIFDFSKSAEIDLDKYDFLILSGSSQFPIVGNKEKLAAEIDLIKRSKILTLGICYGCELMAVAYGAELVDIGEEHKEKTVIDIQVVKDNPIFQGRKMFGAYDAHRWIIKTVPEEFEVLAKSEHGPELIKHRTLPMYGFQFHPEKMTDESFGDELFSAILSI